MKPPFRYLLDTDDEDELDTEEEASCWDTPWPEQPEHELPRRDLPGSEHGGVRQSFGSVSALPMTGVNCRCSTRRSQSLLANRT
jgi:hypothetical protein